MKELKLKDRTVSTELPAFVMGIVNATPDSFWKDSRGGVERALQLIKEGADLLDLGAESSRLGSDYVSEEEEINRLLPVIEAVRKESDIPISIDTRKKNVMKRAFEAGADILNDISALEDDPEMASWCAQVQIPVILMHKRGTPDKMQQNTVYENVFHEVDTYLQKRISYAMSNGIKKENIIIDPGIGIGFGKNTDDSFCLIRNCGQLCNGEYPVLMALSRKTCIGEITGRPVEERMAGTLAADLLSVQKGAFMVRVHDVAQTVDSLKIMDFILNKK